MIKYANVPGYPEYRVGNDGSVWSRYNHRGGKGCKLVDEWKKLNPTTCKTNGRVIVNLCSDGKRKRWQVHRLVMLAFEGPCPAGYEVCHNDGDPTNNRRSNLRYDTRKGNMADQLRHGTRNRGTRQGLCKLDEDKVREIRRLAGTTSQQAIADRFGVQVMTVNKVIHRKTWDWLD